MHTDKKECWSVKIGKGIQKEECPPVLPYVVKVCLWLRSLELEEMEWLLNILRDNKCYGGVCVICFAYYCSLHGLLISWCIILLSLIPYSDVSLGGGFLCGVLGVLC